MNLTGLILENFGKFKKFECNFSRGLNIIKGVNEAGKSTLVSAIAMALYADPGSSPEDIGKAITWGDDRPIVLRANISSDSFTGVLEKDFGSGIVKLVDKKNDVTIDDGNKILEIIASAVGFTSAELFQATACIEQGGITRISGSLEVIKNLLESLVAGKGEDMVASEIIAKIDRHIDNLTSTDRDKPGLLQKLEAQQADIDYNIDKIKREIDNIKSWRNSLAQVKVAFANSSEDYRNKKQELDRAQRAQQAQNELRDVSNKHKEISEKLDKVRSASAGVKELSEKLKRITDISPEDKKHIEDLENTLKYLRPKMKDLEKETEEAEKAWNDCKISRGIVGWALVSIMVLGFAVVDYTLHLTEFYIHLGGASLIAIMVSMMLLSKSYQKKNFLKEQANIKCRKKTEVEKEFDQLSEEFQTLLGKCNISSVDQMHQASWKRNELESQIKSETETYQKLLGGQTEEQLEETCRELEQRIEEINAFLKESRGDILEPVDIERLRLIVSQLEEQNVALEDELKTLVRLIDAAEGGAELLASYLERREQISVQKLKLVEELSVLSIIKDSLEQARQNAMISTLELLEKRTSEILEIITGGKYRKVRFEKSTLKFEIYSDEKKGWVDPDRELSQGTIEQVYLAARLALTEILADKAQPPIILDDPFGSFDSDRLEKTMGMLKEMSRDRQIFLLTADDSFDRWADNMIQL